MYQDMETEKDPVETEEEKVQMTETEDIAQEETVKPDIPEREVDEKPNWMDPEFQDELRKMKHLG